MELSLFSTMTSATQFLTPASRFSLQTEGGNSSYSPGAVLVFMSELLIFWPLDLLQRLECVVMFWCVGRSLAGGCSA